MCMESQKSAPNFKEARCCYTCKHKKISEDWETIWVTCEKHKEFFRPHDDSDYEYGVTLLCMVYNVCDDFLRSDKNAS